MKPELLEEMLGQYPRRLASTVTGFRLEVTCEVVEDEKLDVGGSVGLERKEVLFEAPGDAKKRKFTPRATRRTATIATTTTALPTADLRGVMPIGPAPSCFH
jgi:hypothetical protein